MANYYEQIQIKTATEGTHKRTMKATTDTSTDFGQFLPLRAKILEVGQGTFKPYTFSNMMPLPQPTFGEVIYTNRLFIVPIHQIYKGYEDFRQDNIHVTADETSTSLSILPYTKNDDIVKSITGMAGAASQATHEFAVDDNGTINYYYHTELSLWWTKFLITLGYRWIWRMNYTLDDGGQAKNILKILATAKVYSDYYYNKAYRGDTDDLELRTMFERDNGNLYYNDRDLTIIARTCHYVFYNKDYFTAAWDRPDTPNISNQNSQFKFNDPNSTIRMAGTANLTPSVQNTDALGNETDPFTTNATATSQSTNNFALTQWALNTLKSLTMFLKRNQLAGGDTLQRYLARYGVMNDDLARKKARLIGSVKWSMQVSPIFSNSDTAAQGGEVLGSYAGQAYASSKEETIKYETNCDVVFVEILEVTPVEKYVDGEDMENLVLTKTDIITPEFDNVGTTPVFACELVMPRSQGVATDSNNIYSKIFGWLPRYAYMKTMKDVLAGNYINPAYAQIYLPYTMVRRIDDNQPITAIVHSKSFTRMEDNLQYDRIFYGQPTDKSPFDNINIHHELEIEWWSYAKPLYDNYDWEHEGGKEITIQNQ